MRHFVVLRVNFTDFFMEVSYKMQLEKQSLLIGVLVGATLCAILGSSNQTLMGVLAIMTLTGFVLDALRRKNE